MKIWILGLSLFLAAACRTEPSGVNQSDTPPPAQTPTASAPEPTASPANPGANDRPGLFTAVGQDVGLVFTHHNGMTGQYYFPEMLSPGAGLFDYDNDGDLDVYLVQGAPLIPPGAGNGAATLPPNVSPNGRLFRNDLSVGADGQRTMRFTDVTAASGIDARGYGMGIATGDYTNDGCIDVFLTFLDKTELYRNNCDGTFTDVTQSSGTASTGWSVSAAFLDFDRDGWLDLYVGHYVDYALERDKSCTGLTGRRDYCTPAVYTSQADHLYRNARNGTFVDVSQQALLGGQFGPALGVITADFNDDGWIDVYVTNDTKPNLLWMNQRNGTFRETALLAGAAVTAEGKAEASMGVDAGDFDADGDEDVFMTELPAQGSNLFVNDGKAQFDDHSARSGITALTLGVSGFGATWVDVDNDSWLDLVQVNGSIQAIEGQQGPLPYAERKLMLRNTGSGRFVDATQEAGPAFTALEVSRGLARGDLDNDGDLDLLVHNLNGSPRVLLNRGNRAHHWTCLRLVGATVPRDMLGARVDIVRPNHPAIVRRVRSDGSYGSANDPRLLIGLGPSSEAPRARVRWPDGTRETFTAIPVDGCTTLRQGSGNRES